MEEGGWYTNFPVSGRVFEVSVFFLSSRSKTSVVNGQFSEAHKVLAGIPCVSQLVPTHFLLSIKDMSDKIFRSLVNIYTGNATVYGCTSKNQNDQIRAIVFSSNLFLTAQWRKKACDIE